MYDQIKNEICKFISEKRNIISVNIIFGLSVIYYYYYYFLKKLIYNTKFIKNVKCFLCFSCCRRTRKQFFFPELLENQGRYWLELYRNYLSYIFLLIESVTEFIKNVFFSLLLWITSIFMWKLKFYVYFVTIL